MEHDDIVFDAAELDFQQRVVEASGDVPVAVDYWAAWCAPCRILAPILEKVVREYQGAIKLAKVDTEKNRELAASRGGPRWLDRNRELISEVFCIKVLEREGAEDDPKKAT